jgi:2-keto-4-pentenoate hydratase/2-oxohepta-3-ene-1,7-dioic acid hydratase in catechol pathway
VEGVTRSLLFGSPEAPPRASKIVAVGKNYRDHAAEFGSVAPEDEPMLFLKAPSALIGDGEAIVMPPESRRVDYEGELALVVGRRIKSWPPDRWLEALAGVCCANDVTARDLQKKDRQFARSKSFDTFCAVGPAIVAGVDPSDLGIQTRVNGTTRQSSRTSEMVFSPAFLIAYISRMMTLEPGDLILTGTPAGVGPLAPGDVVEVEIESIGILRNPVIAAPSDGASG